MEQAIVEMENLPFFHNAEATKYNFYLLMYCIFINTTAYHWADTSLHLLLAVVLPGLAAAIGSSAATDNGECRKGPLVSETIKTRKMI